MTLDDLTELFDPIEVDSELDYLYPFDEVYQISYTPRGDDHMKTAAEKRLDSLTSKLEKKGWIFATNQMSNLRTCQRSGLELNVHHLNAGYMVTVYSAKLNQRRERLSQHTFKTMKEVVACVGVGV